jgi:IS5 family transposase
MNPLTFTEANHQNKKRKICRKIFLERLNKLIPWKQLEGKNGRPLRPLSAILRVHCMQLFFTA